MKFYCIFIHCDKISDFREVFSSICLPKFRESQFLFRQNSELLDVYLNSVKHFEGHLLQIQLKTFRKKEKVN